MKKTFWLMACLLLCGTLAASAAVPPASDGTSKIPGVSGKSTPGVEAAQALSTITGVAISPLFGVSAVGAWKYFNTPSEKRAQLPWFAQPYFWAPGLALILAVFIKDVLGTGMPTLLKKPFDVLEVFENKLSGLIAAGAFVPLIAAIFHSAAGNDSSFLSSMGLAMIDLSPLLNVLTVPFAVVIFLIVFLAFHVIHVLILVSPFGVVDAALKSARMFVLYTVTLASFANPYLGAALSLVIIVISCFIAGWAFRTTVFGTVFAWDFLTMRQTRFQPKPTANWVFTARRIDKVPVRTYGKLSRGEQGQLVLKYHPWLVWPARVLVLPAGNYAVGLGLLYPEVFLKDGSNARTMLDLPPRYRTHEHELAAVYGFSEVQDVGVVKGFKAVWRWLRELAGFGPQTPVEPVKG